jgi:hypothetical protein
MMDVCGNTYTFYVSKDVGWNVAYVDLGILGVRVSQLA